jgi:hypothetical protein
MVRRSWVFEAESGVSLQEIDGFEATRRRRVEEKGHDESLITAMSTGLGGG